MKNKLLQFKYYLISIFTPWLLKNSFILKDPKKYELTFFDDFDFLDKTKWKIGCGNGNRSYEAYPWMYFDDKCVEVKNSILQLKAIQETITVNDHKFDYKVGYLTTEGMFEQQNGYFELKFKVHEARGGWPAFWLMTRSFWPPEIDIFEFFQGHRVPKNLSYSLNWSEQSHNPELGENSQIWIKTLFNKWNIIGFEINKKHIKLYLNGILVNVCTNQKVIDIFIKYKWYIILDNFVQLNGNGKPGFDDNIFEVDYIAIYKHLDGEM